MNFLIGDILIISRDSFGKAYEEFGNRMLERVQYLENERESADKFMGATLEMFRRYLWQEYR